MWIFNWRELEKRTGWATRTDDESTQNWDKGAAGWDKRTRFEEHFTQSQVSALTRITREDTVLDACCGAGRLTIPLARRAKAVTGLDAGEHMLEYCRAYARREGLTNVTTLHLNWHKSTPGVDFPKHDIAVACISPAQADVVKFSSAATKYCYYLSFPGPAYRFCMSELFDGCGGPFQGLRPDPKGDSGLNIPFNILYDLGAKPEVTYAAGAWEFTGETRQAVLDDLASLREEELSAEQRERLARNAEPRMEQLPDGRWRYAYPSEMYVLGWDPNQLDLSRLK